MLKNTRPFLSQNTGKNIGITYDPVPSQVYDQLLWSLELSPGDNSGTYITDGVTDTDGNFIHDATLNPDGSIKEFEPFSMKASTANCLIFGLSSDNAFISVASAIYSLKSIPISNVYTIDYYFGEQLNIIVGIACIDDPVLPTDYDISKLVATGDYPIYQVSGATNSMIGANSYKSWRLVCNPKSLKTNMTLGFSKNDGTFKIFKAIKIKSIYDDILSPDTSTYSSQSLISINFNQLPARYSYCWQKQLADLTYSNITIGNKSELVFGPTTLGGKIESNLVLRNTTNSEIIITEIVATVLTQSIASVKNTTPNFDKTKVAGDFTIKYTKPDNSNVTLPAFTGSVLMTIVATGAITLNTLDELAFNISFNPTIKVIPTMITPFINTPTGLATANALAKLVNSNRKLSVQVRGTVGGILSNIGDPLIIKAAIS